MIKTISLFIVCILTSIQLYAQAPDAFQYQALIKDTSGSILTGTSVEVSFKIHQKTVTGDVIFTETHKTTTSNAGTISLQIGKGTAVHGKLELINWSDGPYFIETEVNYGEGFISTGTQQLLSVPFAKYAKNAENVKLKSPNGKTWTISINNEGVISTSEVTE